MQANQSSMLETIRESLKENGDDPNSTKKSMKALKNLNKSLKSLAK